MNARCPEPRPVARALLAAVLALASAGAAATGATSERVNGHRVASGATDDEALVVDAIELVRSGDLDGALQAVDTVTGRNPDFRLAQLVRGDLLLAKAGLLADFGGDHASRRGSIAELREEARARLRRNGFAPGEDLLPAPLLALSRSQSRAIVVDVDASRLFLFDNSPGGPHLAGSFYVSVGKNGARKAREGDQRTPVGVYFVTGRISPAKLPDFYGSGAFPVNYPNEWDERLGRTGHGIWIHGVPANTFSRPPRASDGCMALANQDVGYLWRVLDRGQTPVVIANHVQWRSRDEVLDRRLEMAKRLDAWRRSWESLDVDRYGAFYSSAFRSESMERAGWLRHKRKVNGRKSFVRVRLSDVSMLAYPGERDLVVVTFEQDYRSSNFSSTARKRQYWQREEDGQWRIVYEGRARFREIHLRGIPYSARAGIARAGS